MFRDIAALADYYFYSYEHLDDLSFLRAPRDVFHDLGLKDCEAWQGAVADALTNSELKKAERECAANYTYSSKRAEQAEKSFHEMENDFPLLVERLEKGEDLTKREQYSLALVTVDFHLRNAAHENLTTDAERYDAYEKASVAFLLKELADVVPRPNVDERQRIADSFAARWSIGTVTTDNEPFITSDHPTILLTTKGAISLILLPISPNRTLVMYRPAILRPVAATASDADVALMNGLQVKGAIRAVFSHVELADEDKENAKKLFAKRRSGQSYFKDDHISLTYVRYPLGAREFSFLELVETEDGV